VYAKRIKKFLILRYIKNVIKQLAIRKIQFSIKKQIVDKYLTSGSKGLERYIEFFQAHNLRNRAFNSLFKEDLGNKHAIVNKFFFFCPKIICYSNF